MTLFLKTLFLQKTNRELPNLEHVLPKCVPEGLFEILSKYFQFNTNLVRIFGFLPQNPTRPSLDDLNSDFKL